MNTSTAFYATAHSRLSRRVGPFQVGAIGLGCMNLSHAYGTPPSADDAERLLLAAFDAGVTLFDTAALYGFGANETLVGRVLKAHRSRIVLCSKGGMAGVAGDDGVMRRVISGRPEAIRANCEASLKRLGTDVIDLYYLHRWDKAVPIDESVGAMADLKRAGKIRALGLSEVSAATLQRAHEEHPIAAVQSEYSLWSRNVELGVRAACREIGATLVAFSPLGRGFLAAAPPDPAAFDAKDIRKAMPRFEPPHWQANLKLHAAYLQLARDAGLTPAQLALAWLLAQGDDVLPIPGTTSTAHLHDNLGAAGITPPPELVARASELINQRTVSGPRYSAATQPEIDTEEFAAV